MDIVLKCLQGRGKAFQVTSKGTCLLLGTAEGFGVALHPFPAAVYSMVMVILFYIEVLALKFFPAGKFNQKDSVWISAGKIIPTLALLEAFGSVR